MRGRPAGVLLLLRHGETEWNRTRRVMGRREIGLSPVGRAECSAMAEALAGRGVSAVVTSPLARARETAAIVASVLEVAVEADEGLAEVAFGEQWEGRCYDEVASTEEFRAYMTDPLQVPTPGGETMVDVQRRGVAAVERAVAGYGPGPVVIVSHADPIRALLCHYLASPLREFRRLRIDNCSLSRVELHGGGAVVRFVNCVLDARRMWEVDPP